jgi:D-alanine-D-alanine ligase
MSDLDSLKDKRIGVLCGGVSSEREVSLRSGQGVLQALLRSGFTAVAVDPQPPLLESVLRADCDLLFNALHGGVGEDGTLQAALDLAGRPYTGSGVLACALSMNKVQSKRVLHAVGLPTPDWVYVERQTQRPANRTAEIVARLGLPVVLKPISEGSSVGITIPKTEAELQADLGGLLDAYGEALVEKYIAGTELTVGVVGVGERLRALPVLELVPHNAFYDYEAKYTKGLTDLIAPARISPEATATAQDLALRAHQALGCHGVSRVDMVLSPDGSLWIMEANTTPGMTETSDLPHAAAAEGTSYDELVLEILRSALTRM